MSQLTYRGSNEQPTNKVANALQGTALSGAANSLSI